MEGKDANERYFDNMVAAEAPPAKHVAMAKCSLRTRSFGILAPYAGLLTIHPGVWGVDLTPEPVSKTEERPPDRRHTECKYPGNKRYMVLPEGIVKYQCDYHASAMPDVDLHELIAWRSRLKQRGLVGQHPDLYGGYGYGNLSMRLPPFDCDPFERRFVITGTQTGHIETLSPDNFAVVTACYPHENRLVAEGPSAPSSESLTHGMLYGLDESIRFVYHVHCAPLWQSAATLGIPVTDSAVPYGSPELAAEIERLFVTGLLYDHRMFAMGGHEDGLVSFGKSADVAGSVLLDALNEITS